MEVDGCRGGWLAVQRHSDAEEAGEVHARLLTDIGGLLEGWREQWIAIDMPIGLPERGRRGCDVAARRLLGARRSGVFPAPIRPVLQACSHAEACANARSVEGRGLPLQTFHLLARIRQLDDWLREDPRRAERVVKAHPEVAFQQWNGGRPMDQAKRTREGREQRLRLVESGFPGGYERIRAGF